MIDRREFLKLSGQTAAATILPSASLADTTGDPSYLPAMELLPQFQKRRLSPVEVLDAQIQRIEKLNQSVDCITVKHFDEARAAARESETRYKQGNPRPLEGITIAVKDEYAVKGWVTTMGSLLLKDSAASSEDGPVIERLRSAGAVFHIQTTVPEFYVWMTTATKLWGVTRNPWNLEYTPGGSSGGSGAALAAGFTTLALGSDMGGSIRIPASQCGLYGFKPPFGRIPTSEIPYESEGPMARTFDDMNLLTQHMVGPHPLIHSSIRPRLEFPNSYKPVSGWKIAFDPMPELTDLDPAVKMAMAHAVDSIKGLGVTVDKVDIGFRAIDMRPYTVGLFSSSMGGLRTEAMKDPDKLMPYTRMVFDQMQGKTGPEALVALEGLINDYQRRVQEKVFTRGYRALLMPTLGTPFIPAEHGLHPETDTATIGNKKVTGLTFALTWVWNLLGLYPVVSAPIGLGPGNMPMGMQIIANTFNDLDAFQLASAYASVAAPLFSGKAFPEFHRDKVV